MWRALAWKGKDISDQALTEKSPVVGSDIKSESTGKDGNSSESIDAAAEIERLSTNGRELQSKYTQLSDVYSKLKEENEQMHAAMESLFKKEAAVVNENSSLMAQNGTLKTQLDATLNALVAEKAANDLLQEKSDEIVAENVSLVKVIDDLAVKTDEISKSGDNTKGFEKIVSDLAASHKEYAKLASQYEQAKKWREDMERETMV